MTGDQLKDANFYNQEFLKAYLDIPQVFTVLRVAGGRINHKDAHHIATCSVSLEESKLYISFETGDSREYNTYDILKVEWGNVEIVGHSTKAVQIQLRTAKKPFLFAGNNSTMELWFDALSVFKGEEPQMPASAKQLTNFETALSLLTDIDCCHVEIPPPPSNLNFVTNP